MAENKITTIFFGLDGVIVDTEQYYDTFWNDVSVQNELGIDNFAATIKGMTINAVLDLYFAISTIDEKKAIKKAASTMEQSINYKEIAIPGVLEFINYAKEKDYKIGLVTSSSTHKVGAVLSQLSLDGVFDTIITADSIKRGKPDPMGFVLAQTNLGVQSNECAVFEDAFSGIKAATYAFMRVIGVATTLSADFLKDYTYGVVNDFTDLNKIKSLLEISEK